MNARVDLFLRRLLLLGVCCLVSSPAAADPQKLQIDYAVYNPLSIVLRDKHWLEEAVAPDVSIAWSQSPDTNRALDFLQSRSLDVGSTAVSTALMRRVDGTNVKIVYVASHPEWTALVTRPQSSIRELGDLRGKRIAAERATDPDFFLIRALAGANIDPKDLSIVPLHAAAGRLALDAGEVDAWAGFDPFMAQAELETHDRLLYRNLAFNTLGVVAVRESFLAAHRDLVSIVVAQYEKVRLFASDRPDEFLKAFASATHLSPAVAKAQILRTGLAQASAAADLKQSMAGAILALQASGLVAADTDFGKAAGDLVDAGFLPGGAP